MLDDERCIPYCHGEVQLASNFMWEVHPRSKYIMEERLDHIKQRRMSTREGRIKIEVTLRPLLKEDIAEVSVSMPDYGRSCPRRVERLLSTLNQLPQCSFVRYPVDDPAITQQVVEGKAALPRLRACRK